MIRKFASPLGAAALVFLSVVPAGYSAELPDLVVGELPDKGSINGVYIVRMAEDPVVAYDGGIAGLKATKPRKGMKINPTNPAVVKYSDYLIARHDV